MAPDTSGLLLAKPGTSGIHVRNERVYAKKTSSNYRIIESYLV